VEEVRQGVSADARLRLQERKLDLQFKELEIRRRAVELPVELASLGLRGTLTGAIAGAILVIILAVLSAVSEKVNITGWHLCVFAGIICATAAAFGAYVFQRSFQIAATWEKTGLRLVTDSQEKPKSLTPGK
jgi:hypothetical protein